MSPDFPLMNPYQGVLGNTQSGVLLELNSTGDALLFSTYFGSTGAGYLDYMLGMALDSTGIYLSGTTRSSTFPTMNSLYPFNGGLETNECFASKFDLTGSNLIYSSFLASRCQANAMALDAAGNAYITGWALAANAKCFPAQLDL
jgi:hypothetical protein